MKMVVRLDMSAWWVINVLCDFFNIFIASGCVTVLFLQTVYNTSKSYPSIQGCVHDIELICYMFARQNGVEQMIIAFTSFFCSYKHHWSYFAQCSHLFMNVLKVEYRTVECLMYLAQHGQIWKLVNRKNSQPKHYKHHLGKKMIWAIFFIKIYSYKLVNLFIMLFGQIKWRLVHMCNKITWIWRSKLRLGLPVF